ncbi:protein of unknown function [Paraburkholderia dioscoreae]|uniref:Uncharacterized protein n=1 Tax=Paraburkholderia dioscoreae TaxID=2604047 RepID=A0A5Q4YWY9_9BURK|nr:protein of unknown function [Paraburkholderia dioscoreae]
MQFGALVTSASQAASSVSLKPCDGSFL